MQLTACADICSAYRAGTHCPRPSDLTAALTDMVLPVPKPILGIYSNSVGGIAVENTTGNGHVLVVLAVDEGIRAPQAEASCAYQESLVEMLAVGP